MGEWTKLCTTSTEELPFRAKEFETRYRGYKLRGEVGNFPRSLVGLAEAANKSRGFKPESPVMIGDKEKCVSVFRGGQRIASITMQLMQLHEAESA